jgi:hypothetical protein
MYRWKKKPLLIEWLFDNWGTRMCVFYRRKLKM